MKLMNEIPDRFWSLFRSINRSTYIEALLQINEEYEYSNYFLSREMCIQLLSEYFSKKKCVIWQEDTEDESDALEPPATRVLNWLLKTGWLRRVDDYASMTANIVIPDYAAVMLEAFSRLSSDEEDETQIYIQNVYAILFSLKNDPRSGVSLLHTALVNTKKLNKSLQDMLHNMDKFFGSLLEQKNYGDLLKEHLEGYVEEIVNRKYHILKTSDNFYLYKADIKAWIGAMREDREWLLKMCPETGLEKAGAVSAGLSAADVLSQLDQLERGFDDIEHRIANMDKEHTRYVRATVTRLNYLLNQEDNTKGLIIQLLNRLSQSGADEDMIRKAGSRMNLSQTSILSERSLYKRRKTKAGFAEQLKDEEETQELSVEQVLNLNRVKNRYSPREIEEFISGRMISGRMKVGTDTVTSDEEFEKLILAYDYSTRKKSLYRVEKGEPEMIHNGRYTYPGFVFVRRNGNDSLL
ncbi:MAG: Wadjet anti-phage system protein JetA family protein [Enterocloster sp.]